MTYSERLSRVQIVLGAVAVAIGVWALVLARTVSFGAATAPRLGPAKYEVQAMSLNQLGALVVLGLGVVGIVAGALRRPTMGLVPAVGFGLMGLQVLVQWRPSASNLFASVGSNLAFSLLLCAGFAVTAGIAGLAAHADGTQESERPRDERDAG